jgi:hypothetical protein
MVHPANSADPNSGKSTAAAYSTKLKDHTRRLDAFASKTDDTNARVRSIDDNLADVKLLLVQALNHDDGD